MLLRTLFLVLFITALADTIVHATASAARAAIHWQALAAARSAFANGIAAAQLAAAGGAMPSPVQTCAYATAGGCTIEVVTTVSTPTPAVGTTATSCPSTSCTVLLQGSSAVSESRAHFVVTARVLAHNGDVLLARSASIAFRTFAEPPYATLVGSLDATLDDALQAGAGDDGGREPGTLIHVRYDGANGSIPGDIWRPLEEHPSIATSSWNE